MEFPTSHVLLQYQENMHGIDVVDQCRGYYTCALKSHKWWHRILTFIVDFSTHNSFVLYKEDSENLGLSKYSQQLWLFTLSKQLIAPCAFSNVPHGQFRTLACHGFHYNERHECLQLHYIVCGARTRQFCFGCGGCFMCTTPCYIKVHTQPEFAAQAVCA